MIPCFVSSSAVSCALLFRQNNTRPNVNFRNPSIMNVPHTRPTIPCNPMASKIRKKILKASDDLMMTGGGSGHGAVPLALSHCEMTWCSSIYMYSWTVIYLQYSHMYQSRNKSSLLQSWLSQSGGDCMLNQTVLLQIIHVNYEIRTIVYMYIMQWLTSTLVLNWSRSEWLHLKQHRGSNSRIKRGWFSRNGVNSCSTFEYRYLHRNILYKNESVKIDMYYMYNVHVHL